MVPREIQNSFGRHHITNEEVLHSAEQDTQEYRIVWSVMIANVNKQHIKKTKYINGS